VEVLADKRLRKPEGERGRVLLGCQLRNTIVRREAVMKLQQTLMVLCLSASFAFAQEPKDKKKPGPTPTPTPVMVPTPTPTPVPTPKIDAPPQSSGSGNLKISWGGAANEKEDEKEEKPPAPGIVRVSWDEAPAAEQPTAQGLLGGGSSQRRFVIFIYKLPLIRRRAPAKAAAEVKVAPVQAEQEKPSRLKRLIYKLPIIRRKAPKTPGEPQ
jgi:hypothetical protein